MDTFLSGLKAAVDTLGATVLLPIVIFIIAVILGAKAGKAFRAAVTIGVAFIGINLVLGLMLGSIGADRDRARILSTTSALVTPWANASAAAASSASRPSTVAAVRILTICRSPSSLPFSLPRRRSSAGGSASCLNGAPFLSAPGFFASTGT